MGKTAVLVVCEREGDLGKMVLDVLGSLPAADLVFASDLRGLEGQFAARSFAFMVIDTTTKGQDRSATLTYIRKAAGQIHIPLVFIVGHSQEADQLCREFGSGVVDCLVRNKYTSQVLLKNKFQLLLELCRLKQKVARQTQELDAGVLELEVLQQELLEKAHKKEMLSTLDSITGLFNRYYFDDNLQKEWRQAMRLGAPLSLLFIDVDYLKAYNGHYGYPQGNSCLCELAGVLYIALHRPVDIIARYGGDQFAVILPGTNAAGADLVVERMMKNVTSLQKEHLASPVSAMLTVSIGATTTVPSAGKKLQSFTDRAEQALAEAKAAGRNCSRSL